jgi:hypothetical protein
MSGIRNAFPSLPPSPGGVGRMPLPSPALRTPGHPAPPVSPLPQHLHGKTERPGGGFAAGTFQVPRNASAASDIQGLEPPATAMRRPAISTGLDRLADETGQEIAALADPEKRPTRELQRLRDPLTGAALGTITRHPLDREEFTQQIFRALLATPAGLQPAVLNLSERRDHPPGVRHATDHFPAGVAVAAGPHHTIERIEGDTVALGPNARGEAMQARLSSLRVTDTRTGAHKDVRHIDVEGFGDGSTPPDEALRRINALVPRGAPLVVNCEAGIGRSAMLWMLHALCNYVDGQNQQGRHVTRAELRRHANFLRSVAHEQRGQALLPDARQNSAALRLALEALKRQSVVRPTREPAATLRSPRPTQTSGAQRAPVAARG